MATFYLPKGVTDLGTLTLTDSFDLVIGEGGQTIDAGLDQSGLATGGHLIEVQAAFQGDIGTAGSPLRVDMDAGSAPKIQYNAQGGTFYYYPGGASLSATEIEVLGRGNLVLSTGGTVVSLEVGNGTAYIPDTVNVTNLRMAGGTVTQLYKATANTAWHIDGGVLNTGRGFSGTAYVMGGAEVTVKRTDTGATLPAGGTLIVADGRVKWVGGAVTVILGARGMIDLSEVPNAAAITVTGTAKALARSLLQSKYAFGVVTVTENEYVGSRAAQFSVQGSGGGM